MNIERVGVIGGGLMGSGIAEVAARSGFDVVVHEVDATAAEGALLRIEGSLSKAVERGKLESTERDQTLARIEVVTDISRQRDRQIVVEAATENEELKTQIFAQLDDVVEDDEAILASNTSSIPITRLSAATSRTSHVVGLHFFNPVPVMALVELVTTVKTDEAVAAKVRDFAGELGKTVIHAKDRAGFVVNMLLIPYMLGAIRMYEAGVASAEDIDTGMRLGANHPMGPLELTDFVGLDTTKFVADVLYEEFKEHLYASPPLLTRMVEAGLHGRKSGEGFLQIRLTVHRRHLWCRIHGSATKPAPPIDEKDVTSSVVQNPRLSDQHCTIDCRQGPTELQRRSRRESLISVSNSISVGPGSLSSSSSTRAWYALYGLTMNKNTAKAVSRNTTKAVRNVPTMISEPFTVQTMLSKLG